MESISSIDQYLNDIEFQNLGVFDCAAVSVNILHKTYNKGFYLAQKYHSRQQDKIGAPYICHLSTVATASLVASTKMIHHCSSIVLGDTTVDIFNKPQRLYILNELDKYATHLGLKSDIRFILHCTKKCAMAIATSWLHDSLEDCGFSEELKNDILDYGGDELYEHISNITHDERIPYLDYVKSIKDRVVMCCKYRDILSNSDLERIAMIPSKSTRDKLSYKYGSALNVLYPIAAYVEDFGFIPETVGV